MKKIWKNKAWDRKVGDWWLRLRKSKQGELLHKWLNNRDVYVFLVFLLIATAFWFMNALRDNYLADFSYPVRFVNVPDDEIVVGGTDQKVAVKVSANGYTIVRQRLNPSFAPLVFDVAQMRRSAAGENGNAWVLTRSQMNRVREQLLVGMDLVELRPDTLVLKIDKIRDRKVPVVLKGSISFEKQFLQAGDLVFNPDSVMISGPASLVDTIQAVATRSLNVELLSESYQQKVQLERLPNVKLSHSEAELTIPVEPFSEKTISLALQVVGLPDSLQLKAFPSAVELTFRAGVSRFESIQPSDFRAVVDASEVLKNQRPGRLRVRIERVPEQIQSYDFSPLFVEYLLERRRP